MNSLATQYSLEQKAFEIYLSGCSGVNGLHCANCHNKESWDFDNGILINEQYIMNVIDKIKLFNDMVDSIWILGGEPLDQDINELISFIQNLKLTNKSIWLFTRREITEVPNEIFNLCDYIKCGSYKESLKCDDNFQYGIKLATKNQYIVKVNRR